MPCGSIDFGVVCPAGTVVEHSIQSIGDWSTNQISYVEAQGETVCARCRCSLNDSLAGSEICEFVPLPGQCTACEECTADCECEQTVFCENSVTPCSGGFATLTDCNCNPVTGICDCVDTQVPCELGCPDIVFCELCEIAGCQCDEATGCIPT